MPTRYEKFHARLEAAAEPVLAPDERIEGLFPGQTKNPWWPLISVVTCFWLIFVYFATNRIRLVVATDRRLVVLDTGRFSALKVRSVVRELPRSTIVGPTAGGLWFKSESLGETIWVHKRFHDEIAAVDAHGATAAPEAPASREDSDPA